MQTFNSVLGVEVVLLVRKGITCKNPSKGLLFSASQNLHGDICTTLESYMMNATSRPVRLNKNG